MPGDALVVQRNGSPNALAIPAPVAVPSQDVLRGGMDANTLLHALRRRWLLASCVGLVLAILTAAVLWHNFPASSSATALFRVSNEQESIFVDKARSNPADYEILKKTQLAALRSYYVLNAAVRKPGISSLNSLAGENQVDWLAERLEVSYPQQGEYLSISLSGDEPTEDLVRLVGAVADAYNDEVVFKERSRRLSTRDMLNRSLETIKKEIADKWDVYMDIAKGSENPQALIRDSKTELLLGQISEGAKKKTQLEELMYQLQTQYTILKSRLDGPAMVEMRLEEALKTDPYYLQLQTNLTYAQGALSQGGGRQTRAAAGAQRKGAGSGNGST